MPLHAKDLQHLLQRALSAWTLVRYNHSAIAARSRSVCLCLCVRVTDTQRSGWFNFVRKLIFETRSQLPLLRLWEGDWPDLQYTLCFLSKWAFEIVLLIEQTVSFIAPYPFHFRFNYNEWQADVAHSYGTWYRYIIYHSCLTCNCDLHIDMRPLITLNYSNSNTTWMHHKQVVGFPSRPVPSVIIACVCEWASFAYIFMLNLRFVLRGGGGVYWQVGRRVNPGRPSSCR